MATRVQLRRGTTLQNNAFTGAEGELTYDTTTKGLRIHDGSHQGGYEVPTLVAVQRPSVANNYTWYRKWSDGWIEQGGLVTFSASTGTETTVNFPVTMSDTNYTCTSTPLANGSLAWLAEGNFRTTSSTQIRFNYYQGQTTVVGYSWRVEGIAA